MNAIGIRIRDILATLDLIEGVHQNREVGAQNSIGPFLTDNRAEQLSRRDAGRIDHCGLDHSMIFHGEGLGKIAGSDLCRRIHAGSGCGKIAMYGGHS